MTYEEIQWVCGRWHPQTQPPSRFAVDPTGKPACCLVLRSSINEQFPLFHQTVRKRRNFIDAFSQRFSQNRCFFANFFGGGYGGCICSAVKVFFEIDGISSILHTMIVCNLLRIAALLRQCCPLRTLGHPLLSTYLSLFWGLV